jgi:restriction system protein
MPTRRRFGELVQGVFRVLEDHPDGLPAREVLAGVERIVPPTELEQSEYASSPGVRRFEKIIRFSTINAVKAGWLIKSKGQWTLTDEGRRAYKDFSDPEEFMQESRRLYQAWRRSRPAVESEPVGDSL